MKFYDPDRIQVLSYGGGRQTIAIVGLIIEGVLPRPDHIIMADTGFEKPTTFEYMERWVRPALNVMGMDIEIVRASEWSLDTEKDVIYQGSDGNIHSRLPAFTVKPDGSYGKHMPRCSNKWKVRPMRRYVRSLYGTGRDIQCDMWLGITTDEAHRARESDVLWLRSVYPLMNGYLDETDTEGLSWTSADCVSYVENRLGWPTPPKSSCFICPHMRNDEWLKLPYKLRRAAIHIEQRMHRKMKNNPLYQSFLHPDRVPLSQVNFGTDDSCRMNSACETCFQ